MSKNVKPGRRTRVDLDLFLLALIDAGVNTPYDFKVRAGVSPGASIPSLERLVSGGFLLRGKVKARKRSEYSITRAGKTFLEEGSEKLMELPPVNDLDIVLRTAALAVLLGHSRRSVAKYLLDAASVRSDSSGESKGKDLKLSDPIDFYKSMKQIADSKRVVADSISLKNMARLLTKRK